MGGIARSGGFRPIGLRQMCGSLFVFACLTLGLARGAAGAEAPLTFGIFPLSERAAAYDQPVIHALVVELLRSQGLQPGSDVILREFDTSQNSMAALLRKTIQAFADTSAGKSYFAATGHGAWLPVDDAAMRRLDPYTQYVKD